MVTSFGSTKELEEAILDALRALGCNPVVQQDYNGGGGIIYGTLISIRNARGPVEVVVEDEETVWFQDGYQRHFNEMAILSQRDVAYLARRMIKGRERWWQS